ncbi:MAG: ATP-grasp domain-containing protein [Myxococcales bacterium]|nr:ATP-grasp domain-containing protein [Myxococcales bacterium]
MTSHLIYSNFDFEYELGGGERYRPSKYFPPFVERWGAVLRLLEGCQDAQLLSLGTPEDTEPQSELEGKSLLAWGVTPRLHRMVRRLGLVADLPEAAAVSEVNSKIFSQTVAEELGIALPQSCVIHSLEEMERSVQDCPHPWVLKHPFGVGGRERVLGKPHRIEENAKVWSLRLLQKGVPLIFEPWIQKEKEYSLHFSIRKDGGFDYLGSCLLLTSLSGNHRGNRFDASWQAPSLVFEDAQRTVEKIAACGYFGPVSFDAMCGLLGDVVIERAIVEINARYTFGRLTLALGPYVPKGWHYTWWHPSQRDNKRLAGHSFAAISPGSREDGAFRLPDACDPGHASGGLLLVASSAEGLRQLEETWFSE